MTKKQIVALQGEAFALRMFLFALMVALPERQRLLTQEVLREQLRELVDFHIDRDEDGFKQGVTRVMTFLAPEIQEQFISADTPLDDEDYQRASKMLEADVGHVLMSHGLLFEALISRLSGEDRKILLGDLQSQQLPRPKEIESLPIHQQRIWVAAERAIDLARGLVLSVSSDLEN